jgi:hypothetical protein
MGMPYRRRTLVALALLLCALAPTVTSAAEVPPAAMPAPAAAPARDAPRTVWYGWQPMLADALALSLIVGTGLAGDGSLFFPSLAAGGAAFVLVSPIIHMNHQRSDAALTSLGLRAALPLAGFGLGYLLVSSSCVDGEISCGPDIAGGALTLAAVGTLTALIIDYGWLARETVRPAGGVAWLPQLAVHEDGVSVGVGGTF